MYSFWCGTWNSNLKRTLNCVTLFPDLDDNTSLYSCGESKLKQLQNGRLCSRFKLEELPRDDLTKYLKTKVEKKLVNEDFYTYCRCRGQLCNYQKKPNIKCHSTPSIDEGTQVETISVSSGFPAHRHTPVRLKFLSSIYTSFNQWYPSIKFRLVCYSESCY